MDLLEQENKIEKFITDNFDKYLATKNMEKIDEYSDDFIDLDKHNKSTTIFFDFSSDNFSALSNCSNEQTIEFDIVIVCRNDTEKNLKEKLLNYTSEFCNFFFENNKSFGGLVDYGELKSIEKYPSATGTGSIKVSKINFSLTTQIMTD